MKAEFSKILLIVDYLVLIVLFVCAERSPKVDYTAIICAWIAQLGISTAAYYWKAKNENRVKVPFKVIESLPEDMRKEIDLTQVITSIIQSD